VEVATAVPLAIVVPLGSAALLAGVGDRLGSTLRDTIALAAAAATVAACAVLLADTAGGRSVYWFAGWVPVNGQAIGVDYAIGPMGSGFALLAAILATVALVYSRSFFESMGGRYPALVLVFVAGAIDFSLSGDLFNMFVGFELVAITAVVLTGFFAESEAPLEGAINFAVTSTVGTLLFLVGIALLYDRTQTLNLADMGEALAGQRPDGAVVVAFAAIAAALLTKAAIVPFHFWLPDAYGTAPVPACVLFAGVMSEMGIFGLARIWTTVFAGAHLPGGTGGLSVGLCVLGSVTAVLGAVMAGRQVHLRRMLGFVTVAHTGLYLLGFGLLTPTATAAVAILVVGDGLAKAAMFLTAGVVSRRTAPLYPTSEFASPGGPAAGGASSGGASSGGASSGGPVPVLDAGGVASLVVLAGGALALADLPPFASAAGKDLLVAAAGGWGPAVESVYALSVIASSGAVLATVRRRWRAGRAARTAAVGATARPAAAAATAHTAVAGGNRRTAVAGGTGRADDAAGDMAAVEDRAPSQEEERAGSGPAGADRLLVPAALLLAGAFAFGLVPHLDAVVIRAAQRFSDRRAYDAAVTGGRVPALPGLVVAHLSRWGWLLDGGEALGAVLLGLVLSSPRSPARWLRTLAAHATGWLGRLHSGHVGDQVTWQTLGVVVVAAIAGATLR